MASPVVGPPKWQVKHLFSQPVINPLNSKSYTIPIFNLANPYSRAFHLSWLGFFVAFLSWFAFPPLIPEAIKNDLALTPIQIANSNIVSLCATLVVRFASGPFVDRYGPRKVMAALLVLGAIPSGLAGTIGLGTVHQYAGVQGLYVIRFFIGILGGTFVPCQAWTSVFFDRHCVGTANALVGGWGNMGGGATFAIMVGLYSALRDDGLSQHSAWRAAFAIVPVPCLLFVALLVLTVGTDCPRGHWSERHGMEKTMDDLTAEAEQEAEFEHHPDAKRPVAVRGSMEKKAEEGASSLADESAKVTVRQASDNEDHESPIDKATNLPLTAHSLGLILTNPLTWLPALAYMSSFGFELVLDAQMANVLFALYKNNRHIPHNVGHPFGQSQAGYWTSLFGLLNFVTRPFGGWLADQLYAKFGTPVKKYLTLVCGLIMGACSLAGGLYLARHPHPDFNIVMAVFSLAAIFSEFANGANFSLVPHCNAYNNGVMSGIVGAFGNLGGIWFNLVFRYQTHRGKAFWIIGAVCMVLNVIGFLVRVPKW